MSNFLECRDPKDPDATAIYTMNWAGKLNPGATIVTSSWVVTGLVKESDTIADDALSTSVLLSGGVQNQAYPCRNTIETSDGETLVQTGIVRVQRT